MQISCASLVLLLGCPVAVWASGMSLNADYTYSNLKYSESGLSESAALAGVRGNLGLDLTSGIGLILGAEYQDGNFSASGNAVTGAAVQQVNYDYIRDVYALAKVSFGSVDLSAGYAQHEWYDELIGHYRRRETYTYYPVVLNFTQQLFYLRAEFDVWSSGRALYYMSDVGPGESNVTLHQGSGTGYAAEIGLRLLTVGHYFNRLYLSYRHWDVGDAGTVGDGIRSVSLGRNSTTVVQAGIGISF